MGQPELTDLGRAVAELEDRAAQGRVDFAQGRARLLAVESGSLEPTSAISISRRASGRRWIAGAVLVAAAACGALGVRALLRPEPLRFEVADQAGHAAEAGGVGMWVAAPPAAARELRFSDGSDLHLAGGGRARVTALEGDGAEISLEVGSLDLSIVHREHTHWKVRGGPFVVDVIGTRFRVDWDPVTERLDVALFEGAVTLSGPVVGDHRAVRAGEQLHVTKSALSITSDLAPIASIASIASIDGEPRSLPAPPVPQTSPEVLASPSTIAAPAPRSVEVRSTVAPRATSAPASSAQGPAASWVQLARDAHYKEAAAAADAQGFDGILGSANASELTMLGDVERLGGGGSRAPRVYEALRARFPGSAEAAAAAFILGRVAQDQAHDFAGATRWFSTYLREAPGGSWAGDAMGRLVETADRLGDTAGAERAAARYLAAYPTGSHAAYARQVIARSAEKKEP